LGIDNFALHVRLTEGRDGIYGKRQERWTQKVIKDELSPYIGKLKRIYVCGPPALNMAFDQALANIRDDLLMEASQIEIM
jgi:NAD(P)H-flavin reductase